MKINTIIEGIPMRQKSMPSLSNTDYTIGFEFEVQVDGEMHEPYLDPDYESYDDSDDDDYHELNGVGYVQSQIHEPNWEVVPDGTANVDAEIVTDVMNIEDGLIALDETLAMIRDDEYLATHDNTGLHVNIGTWSSETINDIDWLKFLIVFAPKYTLRTFGRITSTYAPDKLQSILADIQKGSLESFHENIKETNQYVIGGSDKNSAVNMTKLNTHGYIEVRAFGGQDYEYKADKIESHIKRIVRALQIASDPNAYRHQYIKRLYALLSQSHQSETEKVPACIAFMQSIGNQHLKPKLQHLPTQLFNTLLDIITSASFDPKQFDKLYTRKVHESFIQVLTARPNQFRYNDMMDTYEFAIDDATPVAREKLKQSKAFKFLFNALTKALS